VIAQVRPAADAHAKAPLAHGCPTPDLETMTAVDKRLERSGS
jgi:hypothetical protein